MKPYDPANWYWFVARDKTKAFSSASGDYVPAADPAFAAWRVDGTLPTNIASEAELGEVLAAYSLRPKHAGVLDGYTSAHADNELGKVIFKVIFNHENRIRALEGKQPATLAQVRNAVKALM